MDSPCPYFRDCFAFDFAVRIFPDSFVHLNFTAFNLLMQTIRKPVRMPFQTPLSVSFRAIGLSTSNSAAVINTAKLCFLDSHLRLLFLFRFPVFAVFTNFLLNPLGLSASLQSMHSLNIHYFRLLCLSAASTCLQSPFRFCLYRL